MVSTTSRMRVLVVDDCDDAAMTMALLLRHCGHDAAVAESGKAALEQAPAFCPDAMFIDLTMPEVDGLTVARRLRQQPEFAELPLVAVSGHVDAEHRAQAMAAGFTEFLAKPYPLETLQATMERIAARLSASRTKLENSRIAGEQSRQLNEASECELDAYWRTRHFERWQVSVSVEKSGISNIVTMSERSDADELRQWLKAQRCRVGPIFEPHVGRFGFFVYSKRHCIELIEKHGRFTVDKSKETAGDDGHRSAVDSPRG